jgi:hypothetical protein
MKKLVFAFLVGLVLVTQSATAQNTTFTSQELTNRTVERRAVDAVIWGLPLVGEDAVKQAYFRDGKANYNDIVWWPKGGGWKNQSPILLPTSTLATCISSSIQKQTGR